MRPALLVACLLPPQDPGPLQELTAAHRALTAQLSGSEDGLPLPAGEKIRLLGDFTERFRAYPDHPLVLQAHSRIGDLYLLLQDPRSLVEFEAILAHAGPDQVDLRGRARYGQAQAFMQRGRTETARKILEDLATDAVGTRYGRLSRIALRYLDREVDDLLPGTRLSRLGFGPDLDGDPHSTATLEGAPALLVFWSPDSPDSVKWLERLAKVWQQSGADAGQLLALALGTDTTSLRTLAEQRDWSFPVLRCEAGYLDPVALLLSVDGVPTSFLLAADGTLLARDLSPGRLAELLRARRAGSGHG